MICTAFLDFTWTSFRTNRTPGLWPWSRVSPCPKKKFHWGNQDLENLKFRVQSFRNAEKFSKYHPNNVRLTPNKFGRHISTCKCLQAAAPSEEGGAASCEPQQSLISISVNQYPPVVPQLFRDIRGRSSHWGLGLPRKPFNTPCRAPSRPPAEIFTGKMHKLCQISGKSSINDPKCHP